VDQRSLVEQAQRGDHDAFAMLARAAVARLDAAARLILRDRELARDWKLASCEVTGSTGCQGLYRIGGLASREYTYESLGSRVALR